jgi:hypothetical protein
MTVPDAKKKYQCATIAATPNSSSSMRKNKNSDDESKSSRGKKVG